jgi:hypothetical protein
MPCIPHIHALHALRAHVVHPQRGCVDLLLTATLLLLLLLLHGCLLLAHGEHLLLALLLGALLLEHLLVLLHLHVVLRVLSGLQAHLILQSLVHMQLAVLLHLLLLLLLLSLRSLFAGRDCVLQLSHLESGLLRDVGTSAVRCYQLLFATQVLLPELCQIHIGNIQWTLVRGGRGWYSLR